MPGSGGEREKKAWWPGAQMGQAGPSWGWGEYVQPALVCVCDRVGAGAAMESPVLVRQWAAGQLQLPQRRPSTEALFT